MSDRMTLDHIDAITADNRDLTTRIVGLEAERDHHRAGLVRVRAEADAALSRAAELEAALRALVESMPKCWRQGCERPGLWDDGDEPWCDEHAPAHAVARDCADALAAALLLLAKGGGHESHG